MKTLLVATALVLSAALPAQAQVAPSAAEAAANAKPAASALRVTLRMAAFMPGESPPEVNTPIFCIFEVILNNVFMKNAYLWLITIGIAAMLFVACGDTGNQHPHDDKR